MTWILRATLAPADCQLVKMLVRGTAASQDGLLIEENMAVACNGYIWARRTLQAPALHPRPSLFIRSKYIRPYLRSGVSVHTDGATVRLAPYDDLIPNQELPLEYPSFFGLKLQPPDQIVRSISDWQKGRETINRVVEERPPVFKDIAEIGVSPRIFALLASILPNNDNWRGPSVMFRIRKPSLAIEFKCGDLVGLFMPNETSLMQGSWLLPEENDG